MACDGRRGGRTTHVLRLCGCVQHSDLPLVIPVIGRASAQGGAARRAVLALGDSETTDEVLGASEPEVGLDLDDGRDHDEDLDALADIMGARRPFQEGGIDRVTDVPLLCQVGRWGGNTLSRLNKKRAVIC